mgnify:CR=1 FL=1
MKLSYLNKKHGRPNALIDHWDDDSKRYAIWGFEETFMIDFQGQCVLNDRPIVGSPFDIFQDVLEKWKCKSNDLAAVGYMSYDLKNLLFPHINFNSVKKDTPLLWFGKPNKIIPYELNELEDHQGHFKLQLQKDIPSPEEYGKSINTIKAYLGKGDSYQINFTQPKEFQLLGNPFDIYMEMREKIRPHYGMYLNLGTMQILSFSPERFLRTTGNIIESLPMKGTRPRSHDLIHDERLAGELYNSKKDRAEHLMIVDLIRNDLGKICEYGSIKVENLYGIESFETVHQMVSRVHGKLKNECKEIHILKALFPGGSITGAPKERSMQIIDSLENYQRGIYTGTLGMISPNGNMDFNVAIRTLTMEGNRATYPVGGGIVWDSDPLEEWQEAHHKSKIIETFQKNSIRKNFQLEPCSNI